MVFYMPFFQQVTEYPSGINTGVNSRCRPERSHFAPRKLPNNKETHTGISVISNRLFVIDISFWLCRKIIPLEIGKSGRYTVLQVNLE